MPFALPQAIEIANRQLSSRSYDGVALHLLSDKTQAFDVGWVFYYQSAGFIDTGDIHASVVGNAPLFVSSSDGHPFFLNYHRSLAESIAAYRACGNPNAKEVLEVRLTGWRKGALTVSAIQAVRQHSTVGLAQAKSAVESCLANQPTVVAVQSVAEARALVDALASIGFDSLVRYDS